MLPTNYFILYIRFYIRVRILKKDVHVNFALSLTVTSEGKSGIQYFFVVKGLPKNRESEISPNLTQCLRLTYLLKFPPSGKISSFVDNNVRWGIHCPPEAIVWVTKKSASANQLICLTTLLWSVWRIGQQGHTLAPHSQSKQLLKATWDYTCSPDGCIFIV